MGWKQKQTIIKAAVTKQNLCLNKFNLYDNGISCVARYFPVSIAMMIIIFVVWENDKYSLKIFAIRLFPGDMIRLHNV